jgi:PAS domain S-box-containing protein
VNSKPNLIRLGLETLLIVVAIDLVVVGGLALMGSGARGEPDTLLRASLLVLFIGPLFLWRCVAATRRVAPEQERADGKGVGVRGALLITASVMTVGLALTLAAAHGQQRRIDLDARAKFARQVKLVEAEIQRRFRQPVYGLKGARGVYAASQSVGRSAFRGYVASRNLAVEFPGVRGFGFAQRVKREDLERFIAAEQLDSAPDFAVRSSGNAPDLYVIKFIEPLEKNRAAWGFDLGSEATRRQAIEAAINSGEATLSGRITLVQDETRGPGFLYMLPVYRNGTDPGNFKQREAALIGFVYAPIVADDVLDGTVQAIDGQLDFSLFDGEAMPANLVFTSRARPEPASAGSADPASFRHALLDSALSMQIGGRQLSLRAGSTPGFDKGVDRSTPIWLLAGGTLLSMLLALTVWLLATGRARAQSLAQDMTADLDRLAQVVRHTSNAVVITDRDRKITWVNDGFTRLYGYTLEEAVGHTPLELLVSGQSDPAAHQTLDEAAAAEKSCRVEVINRAKDGRTHWVELEVQPRHDARGQLTGFMQIGLDISEKKSASLRLTDALQALTRERERIGHILEGTNVGTWEWNVQTGEVHCNERWASMIGYTLQELSPLSLQTWRAHSHQHDFKRSTQRVRQHFLGQLDYYECEMRMRHRNGHWVWVLERGRVSSWTADGRPATMAGTQMDISTRKQAEEQLRASKAFLERAEQIAGVGGWEVDLRANTLVWSDQTHRIHDVAIGSQPPLAEWFKYFAPAERAIIEATAQECIAQRNPWDLELPMTTATGRPIWIRSVGAVEVEDGRPVRLAGTLQDVTAARAMREELRRSNTVLQSILDNLPCGLSVFNAELQLIAHNQQFRSLLDLPDTLFIGPVTLFENIMRNNAARGEYGPGPVEELVARLVDGAHHPTRKLYERQRHDGKPLEVRSAPMPGGGFVTTYMDISERKEVERLKSEFISTVSHELRTPLTSIYGSLSLLASGMAGELAPDVNELVSLSLRSCERLVRLINDVLDVEKIESKMMTYSKVVQPLAPLIDQAIDATRHYANQYGVQVEFETRLDSVLAEVNVNVDADRMVQVLVNLLSNAAKFSRRGGRVAVRMAVLGQQVRVSVVDGGQGIPEEFRAQIFERFSQADSTDRRQKGGTGLGLSICKSIVQEHRGVIDYVSTLGAGTEFYFELSVVP